MGPIGFGRKLRQLGFEKLDLPPGESTTWQQADSPVFVVWHTARGRCSVWLHQTSMHDKFQGSAKTRDKLEQLVRQAAKDGK